MPNVKEAARRNTSAGRLLSGRNGEGEMEARRMKFEAVMSKTEDAFTMGKIHSRSWQTAYKGIVPDEIVAAFTADKQAERFARAIAARREEYYLFTVDGRPAGVASLCRSHEDDEPDHVGEIYSIYFHPDFWGTPATQAGLEFCIKRLKFLGYSHLTIWVLCDNIRARRFYEKNGFVRDGRAQQIMLGRPLWEVRYSMEV